MAVMLQAIKSCETVRNGLGTFQVSSVVDEGGGIGYVKARHYSATLRIIRAIDMEVIETTGKDV